MVPEPRRPYFYSKNKLMIYLVDNGLISDLAIHQIIVSGVVFIQAVSY
jgi:hypothetical protein